MGRLRWVAPAILLAAAGYLTAEITGHSGAGLTEIGAAAGAPESARPEAPPPQIALIHSYATHRWSPARMLELLKQHPDHKLVIGVSSQMPHGWVSRNYPELRAKIDTLQRMAKAENFDLSGRLVFQDRLYTAKPLRPDFRRCAPNCGYAGVVAAEDPFKREWVQMCSREHHADIVRKYRGGIDPFEDPTQWARALDRDRILSYATKTQVPCLYGGSDRIVGHLVDLDHTDYRQWWFRKFKYHLQESGIDPGDPPVVWFMVYKPGWFTYFDGKLPEKVNAKTRLCHVDESRMWVFGSQVVKTPEGADHDCAGGPIHYTQYGKGEYERLTNLTLREFKEYFEDQGYAGIQVMTSDRPAFGQKDWSILAPEIRRSSWMVGEHGKRLDLE